jgi:formylglycine-generating enzyme required for sulfatase activity
MRPVFAWVVPLMVSLQAYAQTPSPVDATSPTPPGPAASAVVTPPQPPRIFDDFAHDPDERAKQLAALPKHEQPAELAQALASLQQGSIKERVAKLKAKVLTDLVFVEGGTFIMGDWGRMKGRWKRPPQPADDPHLFDEVLNFAPGHEVTLSSYWISKYKTTFAEFDVYTDATNQPRAPSSKYDQAFKHPTVPAGVPWTRADAYCRWLSTITGRSFSLPTEAQWEYAARSRGQKFIYATDDGHLRQGFNTAIRDISAAFAVTEAGKRDEHSTPYPVASFPPTPLGLFDMNGNGGDWVSDWYDATYYDNSPVQDPQGPAAGTLKVVRGYVDSAIDHPHALIRRKYRPDALSKFSRPGTLEEDGSRDTSFRCAVQAHESRQP